MKNMLSQKTKNFLQQLVQTPSFYGDEVAIARLIKQEFASMLPTHTCVVQEYSPTGRNVLLLAQSTTVMIDVHLDTVSPGDTNHWKSDPLALSDLDGWFYGLGVVDVKGCIALCRELAHTVDCANVSFSFCGGEETTSPGLRYALQSNVLPADVPVIVMEPTGGSFYGKHKACLGLRVLVENQAKLHASQGAGGAVETMLDFLQVMRETLLHRSVTYSISDLQSSTEGNTASTHCRCFVDMRLPLGCDEKLLLSELEENSDGVGKHKASIVWDPLYFPELYNKQPFVRTEQDALPFWSHAGLYDQAGYGAVVFGPGHIGDAHSYNESIRESDLIDAYHKMATVVAAQ